MSSGDLRVDRTDGREVSVLWVGPADWVPGPTIVPYSSVNPAAAGRQGVCAHGAELS